jgi:4-amino-4-deoxy-L-arabinose transferase-like glycosyltransferase
MYLDKFRLYFPKFIIAVLVIGVGFLLFYRLGTHPLIDWDESIYARVAQEAVQHKSLLSFTYFDQPWYEKPPLVIWLLGFYRIFGASEWTARIPITTFALATVALSAWWVWRISRSVIATAATTALYGLSFPFLTTAYFVNFDTVVTFWALLSLYAFWEARKDRRWWLVWGAALGLGVLTKNIVGLFPLMPMAIWLLLSKGRGVLKLKQFWYGVIIAAILILPWHVYQSLAIGKPFWDNYFFYHVLGRFSHGIETNGYPFSYYFGIVFLRYPVALLIFGTSFIFGFLQSLRSVSWRLLWLSGASFFLILSSSHTKLEAYITLAIPYLVMLAGLSFATLVRLLKQPWLHYLTTATLILVCAYTGWQFNGYKLSKGENVLEYLDNKKIGLFLKDYRTDLPVYINNRDYKNLGIAYYANRSVTPLPEDLDLRDLRPILHSSTESVFANEKIIVVVR